MRSSITVFALSRLSRACRAATACIATGAITSVGAAAPTDIVPGERLSQWLLRQPASTDSYPFGLSWQVPEEIPDQQALKARLLADLGTLSPKRAPQAAALAGWLQRADVTGRAVVVNPDPRWLEVNPGQDPVLQAGQRVVLPTRPGTATVVLEDGALCQVPHRAGVLALDYLRACAPDAGQRDTVWIAQPDGRSRSFGIGSWNTETQEVPAPGAWIWAPARGSGLPTAFSDQLIRFLGTQGAAEDGRGRLVGAPPELSRTVPLARSLELPRTASDWGEIGLLQTPTARMAPVGDARLHASIVQPYTRITVMFQPLEWLEGGFRYTDISNRLYDPTLAISQQSFKDKSIDAKVRLWKESAWIPEIAVGARDLGGTGIFSGEYLVANKRSGTFDFSLGMGWGYVGGRGNLKNPLSVISDRFSTRPATTTVSGGTINANGYFRGPTSLFGGVQWQTPIQPLIAKLEYDGNNYRREPFDNPIVQRSPINVGVVYRYSPNIDFSAGVERGNRVMAGITIHGGLDALNSPKLLDPAPPVVASTAPLADPASWTDIATEIERQTGWAVKSLQREGSTLRVRTEGARRTMYRTDRLDRLVAVLHRDAPSSVKRFAVDFAEHGLLIGTKTIARDDWVALHTEGLSPAQRRRRDASFTSGPLVAGALPAPAGTSAVWESSGGRIRGGISPSFWQTLGGPDSFVLYQIGVAGAAEARITDRTWINAAANLRVIDNYDKFRYTAPSDLPRVRTFAREYVTTSRLTVNNLQLTHAEQLGDNHFASAYGGLLESMFGGVGGEYLYRPAGSRWAAGVDLNRVRQRGFDQRLSFRDYEVTTGHATLYWDTGWQDLNVRLSAGQYLAGDRGATLDVSRRFDNGVTIGAYATKTNVSAAQFGEGSFDKGIYLNFPFDAIVPRSTNANGTIVWSPLTRDGGAKLYRSQTLFELTSSRDPRAFRYGPPTSGTKTGDAVFNTR